MNDISDDSTGERLRKLRLRAGFKTARDASRHFGWSEPTYRHHENGTRGITSEAAKKYSRAFGCSIDTILTGNLISEPISAARKITQIPVLGMASAGVFRESSEYSDRASAMPFVSLAGFLPAVQYAVRVDGESVNKRLRNGSYAICVPLEHMPGGLKHGRLVHVVRERAGLVEHTIKEARFSSDGLQLMPASTDPRFQTALRPTDGATKTDTTVTIHGVVIASYVDEL